MKNKIIYVFALAILITGCSLGNSKTELPLTKKMILQLNGKKYDNLFLKASLPSHFANSKEFVGQTDDGYKWTFNIPDSINDMISFYYISSRPFDVKTNTSYEIAFKGLVSNDKTLYGFVFDEKNPLVEATYLETKVYPGVPGDENYFAVNDTTLIDGVTTSIDIFKVDFKKEGTEQELCMKFNSFNEIDMDHYERSLAEKDSIVRKYPDSKYLMVKFNEMRSNFKNSSVIIDDVKKIYENFSEGSRSTWYGRESENFIKLCSSKFSNTWLPNATTGLEEQIIIDSSKFNLIIFSASWCYGCHKLIPTLMQVYNDLNPDLHMVYISLDEQKTVNNWQKLLKEKNIPWRSLLAAGHVKEIENKYDAGSIPRVFLVYPDMTVKQLNLWSENDKAKLYTIVKQKK